MKVLWLYEDLAEFQFVDFFFLLQSSKKNLIQSINHFDKE